MTKASDGRKRRKGKVGGDPAAPTTGTAAQLQQPELTPEQQVTILAQQVGFCRNHFFALVQRYAANKVETQQLPWDGAAELINREMQNLDAQLNAIAQQAQG